MILPNLQYHISLMQVLIIRLSNFQHQIYSLNQSMAGILLLIKYFPVNKEYIFWKNYRVYVFFFHRVFSNYIQLLTFFCQKWIFHILNHSPMWFPENLSEIVKLNYWCHDLSFSPLWYNEDLPSPKDAENVGVISNICMCLRPGINSRYLQKSAPPNLPSFNAVFLSDKYMI